MKLRRSQRGQDLVEFALLLPALLLLLLLVGEGGAMVWTYEVLNNAAREGARLAVVPGEQSQSADVVNRVIAYAQANGVTLSGGNISVNQNRLISPGGGACSAANPCLSASQVSISYSYALVYLPRLPFGIATTVPLGASVEMRNFY